MNHRAKTAERAVNVPAVTGMAALEIAYHHDAVLMATWHNLSIVVWGEQATVPLARELARLSAKLVRVHPHGVSSIHVIVNDAALPTAEARTELTKLTTQYATDLAGMVTVLEGTGFGASAMRGFLTSLHWVQHRPFVPRIFATIKQAAAWLPAVHTEMTGMLIGESALAEVLANVRSKVARA